jgi:hypothetical protein
LQILRIIALLVIAAAGAAMAADALQHAELRLRLNAGAVYLAAALALAGVIFHAIRSGRLPLRSWYALPLIIGAGVGIFGDYNATALLSDFWGMMLGLSAAIISYAILQYWADRQGTRDWYGIALFGALALAAGISGAITFVAG